MYMAVLLLENDYCNLPVFYNADWYHRVTSAVGSHNPQTGPIQEVEYSYLSICTPTDDSEIEESQIQDLPMNKTSNLKILLASAGQYKYYMATLCSGGQMPHKMKINIILFYLFI